jgi:hypothetical protein
MAAHDFTDRIAARRDFRDDPNLLFMKPGCRRPVPVNTSTRCAGLVLASLAVIILNLAAQTSPQALRLSSISEGDARTPLTIEAHVDVLN